MTTMKAAVKPLTEETKLVIKIKKLAKRIGPVATVWSLLRDMPGSLKRLKIFSRNISMRLWNTLRGGIPIPGNELIYLTTATTDVEWFVRSGRLAAQSMNDILHKNGLSLTEFPSILDFGCGAGRVLRHWKDMTGPSLCGADYNSRLIEWSKENLPFVDFQVNAMLGNLDFGDETIDFVYALSVFTHLNEPQQIFWIAELCRILKPGGYLLITVHGQSYYLPHLLPKDQIRLFRGQLVVYGSEHEGSNACTAFHPDVYVREKLARNLIVVDHVPEGALGNPHQDVYLLKKAAGEI
jgi:SAM-dependent methyltransferase